MILLSGATGRTGRYLVDRLVAGNIPARVIVRGADEAAGLRERGFDVVQGDLRDDAALARAMAGVERAFLLMANVPEQFEIETRFVDAAVAAGVRRLVKMSAIGADPESPAVLKRCHGAVEAHLRRASLAHTIIRPNFFMDNLLNSAPEIAATNRFSLPMGRGRVGAIAIRDVADAVLAVLTGSGHDNRSYLITGPELLSFADMAAVFSEVLGRDIAYVDLAPEAFREQLIGFGVSPWYVDAMLQLFALTRDDHNAVTTDTFTQITGRQPVLLREFVREHAHRFARS